MKNQTQTPQAGDLPHYDVVMETMQHLFSDFGQSVIGEIARRVYLKERHHKEYSETSKNIQKIIKGKKNGPTLLALSYVMVNLLYKEPNWMKVVELEKKKYNQSQSMEVA